MSEIDIRNVVKEELNNIAPEVNLAAVDPAADLREAIDIDLDGFPEPRDRPASPDRDRYSGNGLPEACHP